MTASAPLVVDASVAVKWYVPEPGSAEAATILARTDHPLAPDLIVAELGNVLWKKVRRGELETSDAAEIMDAFVMACPLTLHTSLTYVRTALDLASAYAHPVYDALYLAVALAQDCALVTADTRLRRALAGTALEPTILLLSDI